jgi:cephalosporin hydroxylase
MTHVTGHTSYAGLTAQQHHDVFNVFRDFLIDIKPAQILEIGTAGGGFTLFLRNTLDEIGLTNTFIKSFELHEMDWYDSLREKNIEINIINMYDQSYMILEKPELIVPYIQQEGVTLVLCDGGHKKIEFNTIAPYLKVGDFIMAHDYIDTWENFTANYENKIWNWLEIREDDIKEISSECNLEHYNKENFDKVVWVCKQKIK